MGRVITGYYPRCIELGASSRSESDGRPAHGLELLILALFQQPI